MNVRVIEYALLGISVVSLVVSLLLLVDGLRDVVVQDMRDGDSKTVIANGNLRAVCYLFLVKILFLFVGVSFVENPVPSPLPPGTLERVLGFTFGAGVLLVQSFDGFITKQRLLRAA